VYLAVGIITIATSAQHNAAQISGVKSIYGFLASQEGGKPATTFTANAATIYAVWKGQSLTQGDTIRVVWIGENVGEGVKESQIRSAETKVNKPDEKGFFTLSRPGGKSWPLGKYRVEFYLNGVLLEVLKFTITPVATIDTQ
jgi:hypothetical protein